MRGDLEPLTKSHHRTLLLPALSSDLPLCLLPFVTIKYCSPELITGVIGHYTRHSCKLKLNADTRVVRLETSCCIRRFGASSKMEIMLPCSFSDPFIRMALWPWFEMTFCCILTSRIIGVENLRQWHLFKLPSRRSSSPSPWPQLGMSHRMSATSTTKSPHKANATMSSPTASIAPTTVAAVSFPAHLLPNAS